MHELVHFLGRIGLVLKFRKALSVVLILALALVAVPSVQSQSNGSDGECTDHETWVPEHEVLVDGEVVTIPGVCAPRELLDLGTITVTAVRISALSILMTLLRPPSRATEYMVIIPAFAAPSQPTKPTKPEPISEHFTVGKCTRILFYPYKAGLTVNGN